jgi:peptide chain release factor 1
MLIISWQIEILIYIINTMKKIIEIRSAEGGDDSKLFVQDLATAYMKLSYSKGWKSQTLLNNKSSLGSHEIHISVEGNNLKGLLNESGGHRIQRVSPTEKRGRVHTSTVTVAVLEKNASVNSNLLKRELNNYRFEPFRGSGAGGQHRNKNWTGIRCIHTPTGIKQERCSKSQHKNKQDSLKAVNEMLDKKIKEEKNSIISSDRKNKVGSGMRGDKIRTYRFQDDLVIDHKTHKTAKSSKIMKGKIDLLWK